MSVKIMSAVFEYVFPKRVGYEAIVYPFKRDKETWKIIERASLPEVRNLATTGSSCKFVLLALADHANDDGHGAYPSVTTMMIKTCLARPTVIAAILGLKYHFFIDFVGESPRETNNYDILVERLVKPFDHPGKATLPVMVNPVYQGGQPGLPEPSFNHPESINDNDSEKIKTSTALLTRLYEENIGAMTPLMADFLRNAAIDYPAEWFEDAFKIAVNNNARKWNYVEAVLDGWKRNGRDWKPSQENKNAGKNGKRNQKRNEDRGGDGGTPAPTEADLELARQIKAKRTSRA